MSSVSGGCPSCGYRRCRCDRSAREIRTCALCWERGPLSELVRYSRSRFSHPHCLASGAFPPARVRTVIESLDLRELAKLSSAEEEVVAKLLEFSGIDVVSLHRRRYREARSEEGMLGDRPVE